MWSLERAGGLALYKQVILLIEDAIAAGHLAPGERLLAERVLALRMGVNRATVVRALDELADRGVLLRKRGSGTYVNSEKWGVRSYAMLNWQGPAVAVPTRGDTAFLHQAEAAREEAVRRGNIFADLSGDGLPPDLYPRITLSENALVDAVAKEQGSEAACLGLLSLRESVQRFLWRESGLRVPLEEILITTGSRQTLFLITQCLLKPGDAVGVEAPSYFYSLPIFQAAGLRLFALPMDGDGICPQGLEEVAVRRSLKMVFLNPVFHNPTGTVMTDRRKVAVLDFCARRRIPIVEDDAYSLLFFGTARDLAPIKKWDSQGLVMYAGSLSSYAGGNIRAGWFVAPREVTARLADVRLMMDAGLSVMPQILAAHYLDQIAPGHLPVLRTALAGRAKSIAQRLEDIFGSRLRFSPPRGGLYCYATAPETDASLPQDFLRQGILPALGTAFGAPANTFRLNYGFMTGPETRGKELGR